MTGYKKEFNKKFDKVHYAGIDGGVSSSQGQGKLQTQTQTQTQTPYKSEYDDYKKELELKKVNTQNDIAKSNRVAQQYLNNYLKQYGLQGSGAGASAAANIGTNYANQMANANETYHTDLANYRKEYNDKVLSEEALAELRGMSNEQAEDYINNIAKDSGINQSTVDQLRNKNLGYVKERDDEFKASRSDYLAAFKDVIESGEAGTNESAYRDLYKQVLNAKTKEDLDKLPDEIERIEFPAYTEETSKNADGSINAKNASMSDFGNYLGTWKKDGKQNKYINVVLKAVNSGDIPNGTYIDMNYGNGKDIYLYKNGTFTKVDLSEKDINKYIADGKYISNRKNSEILEKYKK